MNTRTLGNVRNSFQPVNTIILFVTVLSLGFNACSGTQYNPQGCGFGGQRCGLVLGAGTNQGFVPRPPEAGLYVGLGTLAAGLITSAVGGGHLYLGMSRARQAVEPSEPDRDYLLDQSDRNKEVAVLGLGIGVPLMVVGSLVMRFWLSDRNDYRKRAAPTIQLGIKRAAAAYGSYTDGHEFAPKRSAQSVSSVDARK